MGAVTKRLVAVMITSLSPALGQDDRLDHLGHELAVPLRQLRHFTATQNGLAEILVGHHVQFAGAVVGIEGIVARQVLGRVDQAALADEFAPAVIAVASQQGVVEIEKGQAHGSLPVL